MSTIPIKYQRSIAVICFICIGLIGTVNVSLRMQFGINVDQVDGHTFISSIKSGSHPEIAGLQVGDELLSVDGQIVPNKAVARWILIGVESRSPSVFLIQRGDERFNITIPPESQFDIGFLILNALLGITFIIIGTVVWWNGFSDATVRSFFRLNCFAGTAILLFSHENNLHPLLLHHAYSYAWLFTYCLMPPALLDFLIRFSNYFEQPRRHSTTVIIPYLPPIATFLALSIIYHYAYNSFDPGWITRYETLFNIGFGGILLIYFTSSILLLLRNYLKPSNQVEKDRVRWLLICTFLGLAPFFLFNKVPVLFGLNPFIPLWAAFTLMLIVPIGWGMAVASVRMLKLEWVLSRTIVYAISAALVLYLMLTAASISIGFVQYKDTTSLIVLVVLGIVTVSLAISGLIRYVHRFIDRIYYHDWYRYEKALHDLGVELSGSITEKAIVEILTERLPSILKITKATLLIKSDDGSFLPPHQTTEPGKGRLETIQKLQQDLVDITNFPKDSRLELSSSGITELGYQYVLYLVHTGDIIGILLLSKKLSGAPFSIRDHQLLETMSSYAGTAIANLALTRKLLDTEKRGLAMDMAGGIAHEINNALSPLMGQAQLIERSLSRSPESEEQRTMTERTNMIVDMCNRIKRIALNLGKISEPLRLEKTSLSLNDVVEEILQIMSETAGRIKRYKLNDSHAKFQLFKKLDEKLPPITADRQQLSQVFMNLILNSSDAMEPQGQGTLTVGTQFVQEQNSVV